jgi:hypothetical protein
VQCVCKQHTSLQVDTIAGVSPALTSIHAVYTGHTFFLEDGIEQGNYITGNLGMLTRPSQALLNTDTTPAVFWITNPDNVVRNNVGSGRL